MTYSSRRKEVHNGTNDIISGLRINVVDSILGSMPMRAAARTSILSRKWRNGIKELTIDIEDGITYQLPSYISYCEELRRLTLCNCVFKPQHLSGGFRNLFSLYLKKISFTENLLETLVFIALLLECLMFAKCNGIHHFKVDVPKLKALHVSGSYGVELICFRNISNLEDVRIIMGKEVKSMGQDKSISLINFLVDLSRVLNVKFDGIALKDVATTDDALQPALNYLEASDSTDLTLNELQY
ncbi:uncharacterized protein LOC132296079 [Cornus florida]|uniref:uncharacterized protein LOC132296079 n=1 Tax=Cornus florida TaxID=4283 RepID=UPI00289CCF10|nr:uncharacterized protein LOC132296079 [Cornus florida]